MQAISTRSTSECLKKAWPDEPIFVLLARDQTAQKVVMEWVKLNLDTQPFIKLSHAVEVASQMRKYYNDNLGTFTERKIKHQQQQKENESIALAEHNIARAMGVLCKYLQDDSAYRIGWIANIAMAFIDEWNKSANTMPIQELANVAASNFIEMLLNIDVVTPQPPPAPEPEQQMMDNFDQFCMENQMIFVSGVWYKNGIQTNKAFSTFQILQNFRNGVDFEEM